MLYRKNLPGWERAIAGIALLGCGFLGPGLAGTPAGLILSAAGVMTLLTGFIGFCPACAMVGASFPHPDRVTHG